jgi:N-acetylmuramoyl-L-alanine amidase
LRRFLSTNLRFTEDSQLTPSLKHVAVLLATFATTGAVVLLAGAQSQSAPAAAAPSQVPQSPAAPVVNRSVVVLDPAHGGPDSGAKLGDQLLEKDVTLALAARLRGTLTAAGFTVVSTRDADSSIPLTNDQRAETVNHAHAVACIVIHATGSGSGVHLYASALEPKDPPDAGDDFEPTLWDSAQAESVRQSLHLEGDLNAALSTANIPVVAGRATVRPLDNLMCPAVAIEVAPLVGDATPVTDPAYQQRLAETLARGLQSWRGHAEPPAPRAVATPPDAKKAIPADQTQAAAKATAAAEAAGQAAAKAHGGTQ